MISPGGLVATLFKASVTVATAVDAFFGYVSLLLNGEGATPFNTDASSSNALLSAVGAVRSDAFSPFRGGNYSALFNGTTDALSVASATAMNFGTGSFTVEAWVYQSAIPAVYNPIIETRVAASYSTWIMGIYNVSGVARLDFVYGASRITATTTSVPVGQWTHIAYVRTAGVIKLFVNGVQDATSVSNSSAINASNATNYIGRNIDGNFFNGYISNLRVVNGTAVYTTAFTPPTTPLTAVSGTSLLVCQSTRFADNSTNAFALTTIGTPKVSTNVPFVYTNTAGSGYFPGGTDYMTSPSIANLAFGTGDFTTEVWIYPVGSVSNNGIFQISTTAGGFAGAAGLTLSLVGGKAQVQSNGTTYTATQGIPVGAWTHLCILLCH